MLQQGFQNWFLPVHRNFPRKRKCVVEFKLSLSFSDFQPKIQFLAKILLICQNCILLVPRKILKEFGVSLKHFLHFLSLPDFEQKISGLLCENLSAGLSKLPCTSPEELYEKGQLFWKTFVFFSSVSDV